MVHAGTLMFTPAPATGHCSLKKGQGRIVGGRRQPSDHSGVLAAAVKNDHHLECVAFYQVGLHLDN
jgi:hypothetical protein